MNIRTRLLPGAASPTEAGADTRTEASRWAGRAGQENFPVALRLLPAGRRDDLMRIYRYARSVDDIGDEPGVPDRLAALDAVAADVTLLAATGRADLPFVDGLAPLLGRGVPAEPLLDLVEANRRDQIVTSYDSWQELLGYCHLSADPVGRLVLAVFDVSGADRLAASDKVCTALQIVEHLQDVAEDRARGRRYLPAEDMDAHGVSDSDLDAASASPALRALAAELAWRARTLLAQGLTLSAGLSGPPRLAVAAFTGGGLAALDGLAAAGYDVLAPPRRTPRSRIAVRTAGLLLGAGHTGRGGQA
jgi:squalene synthase HpnC